MFSELGIGNNLILAPEQILANLQAVQTRNNLPKSRALVEDGPYEFPNFSVEMETGTGKTYVYLRTIFELNRLYGFKKFIIVVSSVAIREGVTTSIKLMREHFRGLYDNVAFDSFVYHSKDLSRVRQGCERKCWTGSLGFKPLCVEAPPSAFPNRFPTAGYVA